MKNIATLASFMLISVMFFEGQLNIVQRLEAGTLEKDVSLSQGEVGMNIQIVGATPEQTKALLASHAQKVSRNMKALRQHASCVGEATGKEGSICKVASPK